MMSVNFRIAWRNIWRNKRRTVITVSAVVMAVFLSTFTSSMQEGTYSKMIDNVVKFYTGYIQIHSPGYWDTKSVNDTYRPDSLLLNVISRDRSIITTVPRLESFGLISSGEDTKGCSVIGIDPDKEDRLTGLSKWITDGNFLSAGSKGVIIAVNIARNLNVSVGDSVVLISQGFQGTSASGLFRVEGILEFPSVQLNNFAAYIGLEAAGEFFNAPGRITSLSLMVTDYKEVRHTARKLADQLKPEYSVMTWQEMQPDLVSMIEGDKAGAVIMKGILYMLVGFGILGTLIMMMAERKKEIAVMLAIGTRKSRLELILSYESLSIGMIGVVVGVLISIPVVLYFVAHPLPLSGDLSEVYQVFGIEPALYFGISWNMILNQAITVFIITLLVSIYPLITIAGLKIIKALRG